MAVRLPTVIVAGRPWALRLGLWPVANAGGRLFVSVDLHALP